MKELAKDVGRLLRTSVDKKPAATEERREHTAAAAPSAAATAATVQDCGRLHAQAKGVWLVATSHKHTSPQQLDS